MDVIAPAAFEEQDKAEVLRHLEPEVEVLMEQHLAKRRLWMPNDFLPADEAMDEDALRAAAALRERARGVPDAVRVAVVLNLLTEEGLPHFHRLLDRYLGGKSVWKTWNFMWTAEEDRHGAILRDYARDARLFRFREVELMQFAYQSSGFDPDWDKDPYRVFVYTTLQERATQFSHRNTGRVASAEEPVLNGILASIAADEARHFTFYRSVFKSILGLDPNRALVSALSILPSIDMPGVSMPHFKEMADIVRKMGIYGPWEYKRIVEEALDYWKIGLLTGLNEAGRKAQDRIMALPERLRKVAEYIDQKSSEKSFSFAFIYDRIVTA